MVVPHCVIWCIWKERNSRCFEDNERSMPDLKLLFFRENYSFGHLSIIVKTFFFLISNKDSLITKRERHLSTQEVYKGVQINYIDYINQENPKKKKNDGFSILRTIPIRI